MRRRSLKPGGVAGPLTRRLVLDVEFAMIWGGISKTNGRAEETQRMSRVVRKLVLKPHAIFLMIWYRLWNKRRWVRYVDGRRM